MSQLFFVMAFRKRAFTRGYRDISIRRAVDDDGNVIYDRYFVSAIEPMLSVKISAVISSTQMACAFK